MQRILKEHQERVKLLKEFPEEQQDAVMQELEDLRRKYPFHYDHTLMMYMLLQRGAGKAIPHGAGAGAPSGRGRISEIVKPTFDWSIGRSYRIAFKTKHKEGMFTGKFKGRVGLSSVLLFESPQREELRLHPKDITNSAPFNDINGGINAIVGAKKGRVTTPAGLGNVIRDVEELKNGQLYYVEYHKAGARKGSKPWNFVATFLSHYPAGTTWSMRPLAGTSTLDKDQFIRAVVSTFPIRLPKQCK